MRIIPKKVCIPAGIPPKQLKQRFDRKIVEFRPHGSVIGVSGFIKKYKISEVYYGWRDGDRLRVSHHAPKKTDGSSTTFYGRIIESGDGSLIKGRIMKPVASCIFGALFILLALLLGFVCLAIKQYMGCAAFCATAIVMLFVLFRDGGKTKKLEEFLYALCRE